jgi:hypothetical protein
MLMTDETGRSHIVFEFGRYLVRATVEPAAYSDLSFVLLFQSENTDLDAVSGNRSRPLPPW